MPTSFRVVRVEAEGLASWDQPAPGRLRVRFDGPRPAVRVVRVGGFVPSPAARPLTESRTFEGSIPWPRWDGAEETVGSLVVVGSSRYSPAADSGVIASATSLLADRSSFRVERPEGLVPIRWSAPPAWVDVAIDSDLTIFPDTIAWTASIVCDVSGGPAESLIWTLPTAWAKQARVEVQGRGNRLDVSTSGETTRWTIFPDRPIWGRTRLVMRSTAPYRPGEEFSFPDLAPFALPGRGSIARYDLGVVNVSGLPLEVAGSLGPREANAARHRVDDSPMPPGSADRAFQVSGEKRSLRLKVGYDPATARPTDNNQAVGVVQADLSCVLDVDGRVWGRASYDLAGRPAPFLPVRLPLDSEIPWASVDGRIVAAVRDGAERWLIPIGGRDARRVCLAWQAPPIAPARPGLKPIGLGLPALEQEGVPTLLAITAPATIGTRSLDREFDRIGGPAWEVERAERLSRTVFDRLADFDRDSTTGREAVVADLVAFELIARGVGRSEVPNDAAGRASADARSSRVEAARTSIVEATQATGLDELVQEAWGQVGRAVEDDETFAEATPDTTESIRLRRIGKRSYYRGFGLSPRRPIGIGWDVTNPAPGPTSGDLFATIAFGIVASLVLARVAWESGRRRARLVGGLLGVGLLAWMPVLGGLYLAIGLIGRAGR